MAIIFNPNKKIFTLQTAHTTYQMQVDRLGYLLHLYYGAKSTCDMDYVLTYADRGFSGNPYAAGMNRTYSLDTLPQEYPTLGTGDFRNIALDIKNEQGTESVELLYKSYEIRDGKYALKGLPAVWASDDEAQTLEIVLGDDIAGVECICFMACSRLVMSSQEVCSLKIQAVEILQLKRLMLPAWIWFTEIMM